MPTRSGLRDSGTSTATRAAPTMVTGTLTRNTEPHQKWASRKPPSTGPMATQIPTAKAQMPMACGRSCGSKTLEMMDSVCGMTAAPPRPMAARAKISWSGDREKADSSEPTPNSSRPIISTRVPPNPVTDHTEGEQQAREDQGVGVDRPLELALACSQARMRLGDRLQRDVEDGVVEHDGEKADDENAENAPAPTGNRLCVHGAFREATYGLVPPEREDHARHGGSHGLAAAPPTASVRAIDTEQDRIGINSPRRLIFSVTRWSRFAIDISAVQTRAYHPEAPALRVVRDCLPAP